MLQVGVDIVEIARIESSLQRFGDRFRKRVYTQAELLETDERAHSLAARFAAKEAVIKALDCPEIALHEIEVVRPPGRRPEIKLSGRAAARASAIGVEELRLSLSHSQQYAVAMVVVRQRDWQPPP